MPFASSSTCSMSGFCNSVTESSASVNTIVHGAGLQFGSFSFASPQTQLQLNYFQLLPKPLRNILQTFFFPMYFLPFIVVHLLETVNSFRLGFVVYLYLYPQVSIIVADIQLKNNSCWWKKYMNPYGMLQTD